MWFPIYLMQEPEPIDWEYYRKGIGSRLVDMYKDAYESKISVIYDVWIFVVICFCLISDFSYIYHISIEFF